MPLDHYVTLGRSGLRVSPFALGAMTFGEDPGGAGTSVEESERDPGRLSGPRRQLHRHRELLHQRPLGEDPRRLLRRAARAGASGWCWRRSSSPTSSRATPTAAARAGRSIIAQLHETLRRLRTDYLDVYWLHNWDRNTPIEETMRTLDDLVRAGKIRYIGFSNTPAWVTAQAQTTALLRGWTPLIALQVEYSLLARTVEGELAPLALDQGMALVPWSPLKNGFLSGKYRRGTRGHRLRPHRLRRRTRRGRVRRHRRGRRDRRRTRQPPRRRWRWPGCGPGQAPSCRSSGRGGWPTWRQPRRPGGRRCGPDQLSGSTRCRRRR